MGIWIRGHFKSLSTAGARPASLFPPCPDSIRAGVRLTIHFLHRHLYIVGFFDDI